MGASCWRATSSISHHHQCGAAWFQRVTKRARAAHAEPFAPRAGHWRARIAAVAVMLRTMRSDGGFAHPPISFLFSIQYCALSPSTSTPLTSTFLSAYYIISHFSFILRTLSFSSIRLYYSLQNLAISTYICI